MQSQGGDTAKGLDRRTLVRAGTALGAVAIGARPAAAVASAAPRCADRYLGYRPADERQPYAKYMKDRVDPPQPQVPRALAAAALPSRQVPERQALSAELHDPG